MDVFIHEMFTSHPQGDMCRTVLEDEDFSRHFLSGQNPFILRRVTSLPPNFHVTDHMVIDFLNRGISLESEIKVKLTSNWLLTSTITSSAGTFLFVFGDNTCNYSSQ